MRRKKTLLSVPEGFTIIELMVALVLSFILVGAVYQTFTSQQKAYTIQDQVAEAQQNVRMAMTTLVRDMRMAGHGMPDGGITIGGTGYSNAIKISEGGKHYPSDSITIVGAFGAPSGYLLATHAAGSTEIYLRSSGEASDFNTEDRRYIFIGGIDKLQVTRVSGKQITLNGPLSVRYPTGILSAAVGEGQTEIPLLYTDGLKDRQSHPDEYDVLTLGKETIIVDSVDQNSITVDTDPENAGNQPITGTYPAGTPINPIPIFRVTAVQYGVDPYYGGFLRDDKAVGSQYWPIELAGNIHDFQITPDDQDDQSSYTITLTTRTKNPDPDYKDDQGYRLRTLWSTVALRNPLP